jgi:phosphate transport system protein
MTHLDTELENLRQELVELWRLVASQLKKTHEAMVTFDKDLAREVIAHEKRVNALELRIDRDCENIIALFNPVAIDLRFVLAVLKINNNLERTGDIAEGIAKFIVHSNEPFDKPLLEATQVLHMHALANSILDDVLRAFEDEDTKLARTIFQRDEELDRINSAANGVITAYIKGNLQNIEQALHILSSIRKLERIGDQSKNIAEEIIFHVEAKVLKHAAKGAKEK